MKIRLQILIAAWFACMDLDFVKTRPHLRENAYENIDNSCQGIFKEIVHCVSEDLFVINKLILVYGFGLKPILYITTNA